MFILAPRILVYLANLVSLLLMLQRPVAVGLLRAFVLSISSGRRIGVGVRFRLPGVSRRLPIYYNIPGTRYRYHWYTGTTYLVEF